VLEAALGAGRRPDAVVVTGDIGDDFSAAAYANFRRALAGCGAPVLCLPGNHDDPGLMATLLDDRGFQYCGRARLGGWGAVLLDTHVDGDASGPPVPLAVLPMAATLVATRIRALGGSPAVRSGFVSDDGMAILDVSGLDLSDPERLEAELAAIPGVVECGIFALRRADVVLAGGETGVRTITAAG
jgi:hypothetical protein